MSNLFGNLSKQGLEAETDRLGGYNPFETDLYPGVVKQFFAGKSQGGAHNITLILDLAGKEYRETVYVTNKKGENSFPNKQDPTKSVALPGFTIIDNLCLMTLGKELSQVEFEDKMVKVYDPAEKKEVLKSVPVAVEMIGKPVLVSIVKTLENKTVKEGNDYVPTADTRNVNNIDKVFDVETKATVPEIELAEKHGTEIKATFWAAWLEKNKGQTRDKRTIKDGAAGQSGRPGGNRAAQAGPPIQGGAAQPRKSLFGNKSA